MTDVVRILVAPLVWLAAFSAVYGLHGVLCGFGVDASLPGGLPLSRALLAAAWLLAILLQIGLVAALHSARFGSTSAFVRTVSLATGWVGLVATVWTLFPTVATSTCG